jgi:catechol 2,3-dioxygenase-like lactoylglutathione lyase family enzyme
MTLTGNATVLVVRDLSATAAYYRERLGFAALHAEPSSPSGGG